LARTHGVSAIATAMGLGYYGLKKRVEAIMEPRTPTTHSAFVEIDNGSALFPASCVVEVEKRDGTKMAIRLSGPAPVDVAALLDSFLGQS
jgi:hypothetical protein